MTKYFYLLLFFLFPSFAFAQITTAQQAEIDALNHYVELANESTHGLLIVHRLLETFNQKVNKYVDLESNQLNFYSNADLPKDIFADPDNWFYDTSPKEWLVKTVETGQKSLPPATYAQLGVQTEQIRTIINRVNAIRFELADLTSEEELQLKENLPDIYERLEECVTLYEEFYKVKKQLKNTLQKRYLQLGIVFEKDEVGNVIAIHENIRAFLDGVRMEDKEDLNALYQHLKNNLATAQTFQVTDRAHQNVLKKAAAFAQVAQKYLDGTPFPSAYQLYGNTYYYYNVEMVAKFNRYGSGLVSDLNKWIKNRAFPVLLQMEEPHFFKVIYPKRKIPEPQKVASPAAKPLPTSMKDRAVVVKQKTIVVSPGTITIEIYDHQQQDGDIISLNYNGHWILEKYALKRQPKKMQLPLKSSENFLILHAENLGEKPPNTVTLSYAYKGQRKSIVMESDMNESEMIKIEIDQ